MSFVVVGSLNMDYNFSVEKLPQKGETMLAKDFMKVSGGKGANQAVAIAKLGEDVLMIGAVGCDETGVILKNSMKHNNVDIRGIKDVQSPTGNAFITVDQNGDNTILVFPGANGELDIQWIKTFAEDIKRASYVIMQLEVPLDTVIECTNMAHRLGTKIILNPAPAQKLPDDIYAKIDILTPNETELAILSEIQILQWEDVKKASHELIKKGVGKVIVTLGDKGCYFTDGVTELFTEAYDVKAVDSTAAGDAFNAGIAVALTQGIDIKEALAFANAAGALAVTKIGAQDSLPLKLEIERFLKGGV